SEVRDVARAALKEEVIRPRVVAGVRLPQVDVPLRLAGVLLGLDAVVDALRAGAVLEERERDLDPGRLLECRDDLLDVQVLNVRIPAAVEHELLVFRRGARCRAPTRVRRAAAAGRHGDERRDDRCDRTKPTLHAVRLPLVPIEAPTLGAAT